MRPFGVELVEEGIEAVLLLQAVGAWRTGCLLLQREVHALVTAVLPRMVGLDAFDRDAAPAALTGSLYLASCDAVSEARVVRIPADHVVRCVQKNPDFALAMIASTIQHVHYLMQQVEQLKAQSGLERLAEFLVSLSSVDQGPSEIVLPCNKALLAGWLGLRLESLSRAFALLKPHGVAMHASYVNINDVAKLHQLASHHHDAIRGSLESSFH